MATLAPGGLGSVVGPVNLQTDNLARPVSSSDVGQLSRVYNGLDVTTTNGGVHISLPANFGARIQTGTVNGGFSSDIPGLEAPKHDDYGRRLPVKIDTQINGGGALIKATTTNGGVRITTVDGQRM